VPPETMSHLQSLVKEMLRIAQNPQIVPVSASEPPDFEHELDEIITGLYRLSREERAAIGLGG